MSHGEHCLNTFNIQNEHLSELLSSIKQPQKLSITRLIQFVLKEKALCLEGSGFSYLMTKYPMAISIHHLLSLVCYIFHDTLNQLTFMIMLLYVFAGEKLTETIFNNLDNESYTHEWV